MLSVFLTLHGRVLLLRMVLVVTLGGSWEEVAVVVGVVHWVEDERGDKRKV